MEKDGPRPPRVHGIEMLSHATERAAKGRLVLEAARGDVARILHALDDACRSAPPKFLEDGVCGDANRPRIERAFAAETIERGHQRDEHDLHQVIVFGVTPAEKSVE